MTSLDKRLDENEDEFASFIKFNKTHNQIGKL